MPMNYGIGKPGNTKRDATASSMLIRNVPPDLMRDLGVQAQEDMRTLNNEVIWILQDWLRLKKEQRGT